VNGPVPPLTPTVNVSVWPLSSTGANGVSVKVAANMLGIIIKQCEGKKNAEALCVMVDVTFCTISFVFNDDIYIMGRVCCIAPGLSRSSVSGLPL